MEETPQQELDREEELREKFKDLFNELNLEELYIILEELEREIRLAETAKLEGFEEWNQNALIVSQGRI